MTVWTLAQYLEQLRGGQLNPNWPFSTEEDELIEMGPLAKNVAIPGMKISFPIQTKYIETIYQILEPVLDELVSNEAFSWNHHYGFFSAQEIACGYLCEAVRKDMVREHSWVDQNTEMQKLLFNTCEMVSSGIDINKAVNLINNAHLHNQFKLMVSSLSLKRSTKKELIAYYRQEGCQNMAYQASLFSKKEFEHALVEQLYAAYNQVVKVIQNARPIETKKSFFMTREDNFIELLRSFKILFTDLLSLNLPSLIKEVMQTVKQYSPFLRHSIENNDDKDSKLEMQELAMLMDSLIQKGVNKSYPKYIKYTRFNNVNHNSL
ncbi:hypothetical protein [Legionella gresilensis]|uniref:hypothetical protein n=1 Tax=Legionella gresilensis TaxID=91823 RepID=UPI0010416BE8|nr:hypothetical protein [Legionella gresilensis]